MSETSPNPAEHLAGKTINDKWEVLERLNVNNAETTGGGFSVTYRVENMKTKEKAFMKVLDIVKALKPHKDANVSQMKVLNMVTEAHLFECHLVETCRDMRMTRVVRGIDKGDVSLEVPGLGAVPHGYIVASGNDLPT